MRRPVFLHDHMGPSGSRLPRRVPGLDGWHQASVIDSSAPLGQGKRLAVGAAVAGLPCLGFDGLPVFLCWLGWLNLLHKEAIRVGASSPATTAVGYSGNFGNLPICSNYLPLGKSGNFFPHPRRGEEKLPLPAMGYWVFWGSSGPTELPRR